MTSTAETDLLQSDEYVLARHGESTAAQARAYAADLAAIQNGDRRFGSAREKGEEVARIKTALSNLLRAGQ